MPRHPFGKTNQIPDVLYGWCPGWFTRDIRSINEVEFDKWFRNPIEDDFYGPWDKETMEFNLRDFLECVKRTTHNFTLNVK